MTMREFRARYPEYNSLSDEQLGRGLYAKFPPAEGEDGGAYLDRVASGGAGTPAATGGANMGAQPAPSPALKTAYNVASALPVVGQALRGSEAVMRAGGPVAAIQRTAEHAGKEVSGGVSGIGPLLAGIGYSGALGARHLARAAGLPESVDPTLTRETEQAGKSLGNVARTAPGEMLRQIVQEGYDPGAAFIERPVGTSLDALMLSGLPSAGAKMGARVAARFGKEALAKTAMTAGEAMEPMALLRKAARENFPELAARSEQTGKTRDIFARARKGSAIKAETQGDLIRKATAGLSPEEQKAATAIIEGTAMPLPETMIPPRWLSGEGHGLPQGTPRGRIMRAVEAYKADIAQRQAEELARGTLTPEIIKRRAYQPLRLAEGGPGQAALEAAPRTGENLARLDQQTENLAAPQRGLPTPTYVPGMPEKPTLRSIIGNLRAPNAEAPKPGFLKRSTGATYLSGKSERGIGRIWAKHSEAVIHDQQNLEISKALTTAPGVRAIQSPAEVNWDAGERLMAPGMYARNVSKAVADGGDVIKTALESGDAPEALNRSLRATMVRGPEGAGGLVGPFYAVPKHVAQEVSGQLASHPPWMRVVFDTPNAFQRWMVLTLRPGFYVNNIVGGTALATLSGAKPSSFIKAMMPEYIEQMPAALKGSGFAAVEAPAASSGTKAMQDVARFSGKLNEGVDEYTRRASFISEVERRAAAQSIRESGRLLERGLSFAQKAERLGPEGVQAAADHVNRFINDYTRQSPFQRRYLRIAFPFQSFTVHMARLATRLPLNNPMRANLLAKATEFSNEYQQDRFAQAGHKDVPPYRRTQFPLLAGDRGQMWTVGTAGVNPASGLGTGTTEFQNAPGLGAAAEAATGSFGPTLRGAWEFASGRRGGTGQMFTSPDVVESYGGGSYTRRNPETGLSEITGHPRPALGDILRSQIPLAGLAEKRFMPNETYDLWRGPWGFGGPAERLFSAGKRGGKRQFETRARKFSQLEAIMGYLGIPVRNFEPDELEYSDAVKSAVRFADEELNAREEASKRKGKKK